MFFRINFMIKPWNFPVCRFKKIDYTLFDTEAFNFSEYYPFSVFNVLESKKGTATPLGKHRLQIESDTHLNKFIIGNYTIIIQEQISKKDPSKKKYVLWIFPNAHSTSPSLESSDRLKDLYSLDNNFNFDEMFQKIIELKIYDPEKHFIGVNNFYSYDMAGLHFQILPKEIFNSATYSDLRSTAELRMQNLLNVKNNINVCPKYYENFLNSDSFCFYSDYHINNL